MKQALKKAISLIEKQEILEQLPDNPRVDFAGYEVDEIPNHKWNTTKYYDAKKIEHANLTFTAIPLEEMFEKGRKYKNKP